MVDYRISDFENVDFSNVKSEKENLGRKIDSRAKTNFGEHYSKLSLKSGVYYELFQNMYHQKCAYCGVNIQINNAALYEIDHYINKKSEKNPTGKSLNNIENLVFSCRNCNQSKKDLDVTEEFRKLYPDNTEISKIFERGSHYEIKIANAYKKDNYVKEFYSKLKFDFRFRKLDYLLLNLYFLKEKKSEKQDAIKGLYTQLLELRNEIPSLKKLK
ncbi:HNH endonuclease [Streptococcus equinus]|uniref:HNH endonuclease n=1 Tax=Streptococcus equinus TaxID=1335 RepID=UPI0004258C55|nr:HNH endonuclease signature motif containing protein [Streptococcus equinus]